MNNYVSKIKLRRDTSANWDTNNPILDLGEPGYVTDTGVFKIGDGINAWIALPSQSTAQSAITDAPNDNKLYGRKNLTWQEVIIPVLDQRKNLNDLMQTAYNTELDMGYLAIIADGTQKEVFGIRKLINVTAEANTVDNKEVQTNVGSIIDIGGTFEVSSISKYLIPTYTALHYANVNLNTDNHDITIETRCNVQRTNSKIDIWVLYTKNV